MNWKPILKSGWEFVKQHSTKFLAGGAIVSEVLGFWFMHKEAPIVREKIDALGKDAKTWDKIKVAAPIYLPAATMLLISGGCIGGGAAIAMANETKLVAMTNLAMASQATIQKYEEKVINQLGPEKAQELHNDVAKDIMSDELPKSTYIHPTGKGTDIFYDPLTSRYIMTSENAIADAVMSVNTVIDGVGGWCGVNQWYDFLNVSRPKLADVWGWNQDNKLKVEFTEGKTEDGRLCWKIIYYRYPVVYRDVNGRVSTLC